MMINSPIRFSATILTLTLLCAHGASAADFEWQGAVDKNDSVTIRGVNGKIHAQPISGNTIIVEASKRAKRSDPDSVEIQVIEDAEGVLICAVYPSRGNSESNRCARGDDYKMNVKKNDVTVNFVVKVPADVRLDAATVNGGIKARGLSADVEAATVNGGIDVESNGVVSATTVNGAIDASMDTSPEEPIKLTTVNGAIELELSKEVDASLEIGTVNGRIKSDFPIDIQGKWGPKSASGEIGRGGSTIELKTVNGSVKISSR